MQHFHPLLVHFPVAFLAVALLLEILFALTRRPLADALARWLLTLGALGSGLAALTGWLASQSVARVPSAAHPLVEHRTFGFLTLGTAAALTFWRWGAARAGGPRPRALFLAGMIGLGALLFLATREGGELVYEHGVGTKLTAPGGPLAAPPGAADSLARRDVPKSTDFR